MSDMATTPVTLKRRRLTPPLWWWGLVALAIIAGAFLQVTRITEIPAYDNMICISLGLLMGLILLVWFMFLSGYTWRTRLMSLTALLIAGGLYFSVFEIAGFTGNMLPIFRLRSWALQKVAPVGDLPKAAGNTVDLTTTTPEDFCQFLGPNRDEAIENVKLARNWDTHPPKLLWKQPIGDGRDAGWSGFSIVNGYAVTLEQRDDEELVTCYEVKTGKLQWQHGHKARYSFFIAGTGPRSTPTIHKGKVYALGATGVLFCLDGSNGKEIWKKDLLQEVGITADNEKKDLPFGRSNSPLIVNNLVVIPGGGITGGKCVSLIAYNKDTGEKVWTGGDQQISYASPTLATLAGVEQILTVNEATVSGHDPASGKVLWQFEWPGTSNAEANCSNAVPVDSDKVFISKGYGRGSALWQIVRVGKSRGHHEPREIWNKKNLLRTKFTNVAIRNDLVYGLSDGLRLDCVELETGTKKWSLRGDFGDGQMLRVGDLLLILSEDGHVSLVDPTSEGGKILGSVKALDGITWNNLALYGPYLLVRNGSHAACYELPLEKAGAGAVTP